MAPGPKRLGELLVEWGLLTEPQLEETLALQAKTGRRLGVLLVERGLIHATKLTQVLSYQFHLPFVSLGRVRFTPELLHCLPPEVAQSRRAVPICQSGDEVLFMATDDPADPALAAELSSVCGKEVRLMVAAPDELQEALEKYYAAVPSGRPPSASELSIQTGAVRVAVSRRPPGPGTPAAGASYVEELGDDEVELITSEAPRRVPRLVVVDSEAPEPLPAIVVVDSDPVFAEMCERAASAQGLRMETAGLMSAEELITKVRPIAVVMMEDVFAMERLAFTRLSIEVGAHLVIWSDELSSDYLEPLLAAAKRHAST